MMNSIQDIQSQLLNMAQDPVLVKILLGLTLAGFSCSLLSSFVVVKRMVLAGTAIASSAFVGAVVGMICLPSLTFSDWPILASAAGGSVFIAVVVLFLNRSAVPSTDAVLGVFILGVFAALMISTVEWGIPIPDLTVYLFGTPHVTSVLDHGILTGAAVLVVGTVFMFTRQFRAVCIDPSYARAIGISIRFYEFWFFFILTVTILIAIYTAGLLFTLTMLILPGLCSRMLVAQFYRMMLLALTFGLISCVISVVGSQRFLDLPSSIILVLFQLSITLMVFGIHRIRTSGMNRVQ